MKKLVLIDGNAIMHRAFHALPPLTTPKNEPIGAVYGFTSMLLKVIEDLNPDYIFVCFDRKEPTFRKKLSKDYQAHRPETDTNLIPQFTKVKHLLKALNIPVYEKKGFEADDLIGTISHSVISHRSLAISHQLIDEVIVVTGDRDLLQLVNDKVKVYLPIKGLSQAKLMDKKDVFKMFGVTPKQVVDYKALIGDQSDNYKGVGGIGPKIASNLLQKYNSLENIYEHLDELPKGIKQKLKKDKNSALLSQKLAQIVNDVPIKIKKFQKWDPCSSDVKKILDEFGFKTLEQRISKLSKKQISENQKKLFNI